MNTIIPALIPQSVDELRQWLEVITYTDEVQVDVVDGIFAKPASWPFTHSGEGGLVVSEKKIMLDMMVSEPEHFLPLCPLIPSEVVVHARTVKDVAFWKQLAEEKAVRVIVGLQNTDVLSRYAPLIAEVDGIQVMGIDVIGVQGQSFSPLSVAYVKEVREAYPEIEITVDGSVNAETLRHFKNAGANRFVVGSALQGSDDPTLVFAALQKMASS